MDSGSTKTIESIDEELVQETTWLLSEVQSRIGDAFELARVVRVISDVRTTSRTGKLTIDAISHELEKRTARYDYHLKNASSAPDWRRVEIKHAVSELQHEIAILRAIANILHSRGDE